MNNTELEPTADELQLLRKLGARAEEYRSTRAEFLKTAVDTLLNERPGPLAPPTDSALPFFAYGSLKTSELAHGQIARFVSHAASGHLSDYLLGTRDGIPLLISCRGWSAEGELLWFSESDEAYWQIRLFEPRTQYRWVEVVVGDLAESIEVRANTLLAVKPDAGAGEEHINEWTSAQDPLLIWGLPAVHALMSRKETCEPGVRRRVG